MYSTLYPSGYTSTVIPSYSEYDMLLVQIIQCHVSIYILLNTSALYKYYIVDILRVLLGTPHLIAFLHVFIRIDMDIEYCAAICPIGHIHTVVHSTPSIRYLYPIVT